MNKIKFSFLLMAAFSLLMVSCIRDEALNTEADIETAIFPNGPEVLQTEPQIGNTSVTFRLKEFNGSFLFAPEFTVTAGAKLSPESGTLRDFSEPQTYTVTSEDGQWSKEYTVSVVIDDNTDLQFYSYSFENADVIDGQYNEFYELSAQNQKIFNWATANPGYAILAPSLAQGEGVPLTPSFFPTAQLDNGFEGKGVRLQTKTTGPLGSLFQSPQAAGNLFIGAFNNDEIFTPLKAVHFGLPYTLKNAPKMLTGYFKYKAGPTMEINTPGKGHNLSKDTWNVYAILFDKRDAQNYLTGDHGFTDPRMVATAVIDEAQRIETNEWTKFEIPFTFLDGKSFDPTKEYFYTIVVTSSIDGEFYNGAVGSVLDIDEIQLITE